MNDITNPEFENEVEVKAETEVDVETLTEVEVATEAEVEVETETVVEAELPASFQTEKSAVSEFDEFCQLFPGVGLDDLPDEVRSSLSGGLPLSAAYALYICRREAEARIADSVNARNRELSFALKKNTVSESYFSPDEVREMSQSEVRTNYKKIIESMSHWH